MKKIRERVHTAVTASKRRPSVSLASHTSHAAHSVQMSAWKCWRQEKKMKQAIIRCSKSLLSRQNKEKKKTPASPTYPCRTPTRFLGKTTVSCQGLADNLNLPVQSNHQTQQNKQHRSKPFFFSRCRACLTEEEAQHPIKCLYKAMYNVEGNKCLQEQSLWRLKKKMRKTQQ